MVTNLSQSSSIFNQFIAEIRDEQVQKDAMRFRRNMERIAEILGYELSKKLPYQTVEVTTPLGISSEYSLKEKPVLATILRAGLAMHNGLLNVFDSCDSAFISAYRKHTTPEEFDIYVEYMAAPQLDNKIWIISDPMLATGNSMVTVYQAMLEVGKPKQVFIVSAIATPEALDMINKNFPKNTEVFVGAIDNELTSQSYIVPGLGDAGDLAYGEKL
jgi:uracil phosphoribosyltransferase